MTDNTEEILDRLQQEVDLKPLDDDSVAKIFFKLFPFLSSLSQTLEKSGLSVSKLVAFFQSAGSAAQVAKGFQITGTILSGLDWLILPVVYLGYRWAGKPFPYSFSTGLKWSYSLILFTLAVATLAVPAAALPIAIVSGSLVLASSIVLLGKQLWGVSKLGKKKMEHKNLNQEINQLKDQLRKIQHDAYDLKKTPPFDDADVNDLLDKHQRLVLDMQEKSNRLKTIEMEQKLLSTGRAVDKLAGVTLSSIALSGLVIALFVPPVGLTVLVTTSALGLGYLGARLATKALAAIFKSKSKPNLSLPPDKVKITEPMETTLKNDLSDDSTLQISTALCKTSLFGEHDPKKFLQALIDEQHKMGVQIKTMEERIHYIHEHKDWNAALLFMQRVSERLVDNYPADELRVFFNELPGFKAVIPILTQAIHRVCSGDISLSEDALASLRKIKPIQEYIEQYNNSHDSSEIDLSAHLENLLLSEQKTVSYKEPPH